MPRWGKGWEVGLQKTIDENARVGKLAADILERECGVRHEKGSRADLCPACVAFCAAKVRKVSR